MPVILQRGSYDLRLNPGFGDLGAATTMLKLYDAGLMRRHAVSMRVNSATNDGPECSEPIEDCVPIFG
jgi:putative SOS response-associated peptidase YedK